MALKIDSSGILHHIHWAMLYCNRILCYSCKCKFSTPSLDEINRKTRIGLLFHQNTNSLSLHFSLKLHYSVCSKRKKKVKNKVGGNYSKINKQFRHRHTKQPPKKTTHNHTSNHTSNYTSPRVHTTEWNLPILTVRTRKGFRSSSLRRQKCISKSAVSNRHNWSFEHKSGQRCLHC